MKIRYDGKIDAYKIRFDDRLPLTLQILPLLKTEELLQVVTTALGKLDEKSKQVVVKLLGKQGIKETKAIPVNLELKLTADENIMFDVLATFLKIPKTVRVLKRDRENFGLFTEATVKVFNAATKNHKNITRVHKEKFFIISIKAAAASLRDKNIPVSLRTICNQHARIFGLLDRAFPGYLLNTLAFYDFVLSKQETVEKD